MRAEEILRSHQCHRSLVSLHSCCGNGPARSAGPSTGKGRCNQPLRVGWVHVDADVDVGGQWGDKSQAINQSAKHLGVAVSALLALSVCLQP